MTLIDQFSSVFRAAAKTRYRPGDVPLSRALLVTDLDPEAGAAFEARVNRFLGSIIGANSVQWTAYHGTLETVGALLKAVQDIEPELICTYRNLYSGAFQWPYTLGDHAEVLTQVTKVPVLLMPRPDATAPDGSALLDRLESTREVMAITDHLAGDSRLVDYAVNFTAAGGALVLAHVEDDAVFERYLEAIGKIPELDTDVARRTIEHRLLKDAQDYAESIQQALSAAGSGLSVSTEITLGHHLTVYRGLVEKRGIDLLVLNTKDDDQLAMHGLAYPLAVELRHVPLLML